MSEKGSRIRTDEQIIGALEDTNGNLAAAARHLGVARRTLHGWRESVPAIREAAHDIDERTKDLVEAALFKKIADGDGSCIQFYLKNKAPDRGYSVHVKLSAPDGGPVQIQQVPVDFEAIAAAMTQEERDVVRGILARSTPVPAGGPGGAPGA